MKQLTKHHFRLRNRRFLSFALTLVLIFMLTSPALASKRELTEADVLAAIENGTAIVQNEVRSLDSYTEEEIAANPALTDLFMRLNSDTRSVHNAEKQGMTYSTLVTMPTSGEEVFYMSCLISRIQVTDVGSSGSADISTRLEISDYVTVNGEVSNWENLIKFKNIQGSMGCGENTVFTSSAEVYGRVGGITISNVAAILDVVTSVAGWSTVNSILSGLSLLDLDGQSYVSTIAFGPNVRAVGAKWRPAAALFNDSSEGNGHYLQIESSISTLDSSEATNVTAHAVASWSYDVYHGVSPYLTDREQNVSVDYVVNMTRN